MAGGMVVTMEVAITGVAGMAVPVGMVAAVMLPPQGSMALPRMAAEEFM
jgi:hypothetical protein